MMQPPYHSSTRTITSATWSPVLVVRGAVLGRQYAIRIKGVSLSWRVVADGLCGRETLVSGSISASPSGPTRVTGLPETIGADTLVVEVQLALAVAQAVSAEASWIPTTGPAGAVRMDTDGRVVGG